MRPLARAPTHLHAGVDLEALEVRGVRHGESASRDAQGGVGPEEGGVAWATAGRPAGQEPEAASKPRKSC